MVRATILTPDIVFVGKARVNRLSDRGVEVPSDLVVEVLSPSTEHRDRGVKLERYRRFGVAEYWIADPEECTIEVWDLAAKRSHPPTSVRRTRCDGRPLAR